MRKVVSNLFISLDGVTEAPNEWQFDNFDEDMGAAMGEMLESVDTMLLGRVTYEAWASYWPGSKDEPFASFINSVPKVVVSNTLKDVSWGDYDTVSLLGDNLAEGVNTLKAQPGKTISISGSVALVRSLLKNDLIDELTLMVHPVVVGKGNRLFEGEMSLKRLELVSSKTTRTGVSLLTYKPRTA